MVRHALVGDPCSGTPAKQYGIADMTARRAMRELRERGLIRTVRGKGSYVVPAPPAAEDSGGEGVKE